MVDYKERNRVNSINAGFAEYPWLSNYVQKDALRELKVDNEIGSDFYKSRTDRYAHVEVMLLIGKNGEYLGEVDEVKTPKGVCECFAFAPRQETVMEAIWRVPDEVYFVLNNKTFTHMTLYLAPEGLSMREHSQKFAHLF